MFGYNSGSVEEEVAGQENCTYVNMMVNAHSRSAEHFPMKSRDGMQMSVSEQALTDDSALPRRDTFTILLNVLIVSSNPSGTPKHPPCGRISL